MRDLQLLDQYPAALNVEGGQLRQSGSLYNVIFLLLFGEKSALNEFLDYSLDSKIPDLQRENLTNTTRLKIISEAERVLNILVSKGIAKSVSVDAIITAQGQLFLEILTEQPENELTYQLNWGDTGI